MGDRPAAAQMPQTKCVMAIDQNPRSGLFNLHDEFYVPVVQKALKKPPEYPEY